jgi:hypothetical protein
MKAMMTRREVCQRHLRDRRLRIWLMALRLKKWSWSERPWLGGSKRRMKR